MLSVYLPCRVDYVIYNLDILNKWHACSETACTFIVKGDNDIIEVHQMFYRFTTFLEFDVIINSN